MEPEGSLPGSKEPPLPIRIYSQISPLHPILLRSISILSSKVHLGLPIVLFPSGFATNILYASVFNLRYVKTITVYVKLNRNINE
jgi:hypothetical protein